MRVGQNGLHLVAWLQAVEGSSRRARLHVQYVGICQGRRRREGARDQAQARVFGWVAQRAGMIQQQAQEDVGVDPAKSRFNDDAAELDFVAGIHLALIHCRSFKVQGPLPKSTFVNFKL
jgi:hypothetical protein